MCKWGAWRDRQHLALCNWNVCRSLRSFRGLSWFFSSLPRPTLTQRPRQAHHRICITYFAGQGGGFYFLDIRLSFLANFLHQVHLYKYILYLCFGFVFVFVFFFSIFLLFYNAFYLVNISLYPFLCTFKLK